jgi:hypothetical protein
MAEQPMASATDPLELALEQLEYADKKIAKGVVLLSEAFLEPVNEPVRKRCKFWLNNKKYSARLSPGQCTAIMNTVNGNGNVLDTVGNLLKALITKDNDCVGALTNLLNGQQMLAAVPKQDGGGIRAPIGCCVFTGGQIGGITLTMCKGYPNYNFHANEDCRK